MKPNKNPVAGAPSQRNASGQSQWVRGYFCAVAVLLREEGAVTPAVKSLFDQGGSALKADVEDQELFRAHGLM